MIAEDNKMEDLSSAKIFDAISNESSLAIFDSIAAAPNVDTDVLRTKLSLTRKQYYSRISGLLKADLIKRVNGKYSLTLFGEILFNATSTVEKAFNNSYWKLKAIDSFETEAANQISTEQRNKIIETLLKDEKKIKEIVLAKLPS